MTHYKILASRSGSFNGMDWDADYEITFVRTVVGYPPYFNPATGEGDPGCGDEFEVVDVKPTIGIVDAGAFTDLAQKDLEEWAYDWLHDEGYDRACYLVRSAT